MGRLSELSQSRRLGTPAGIYSVCSAHPLVVRAAVRQAEADSSDLLLEATSNQVNQYGGYTGMQPEDFVAFVRKIAAEEGLPQERLILGGDHLGPNPWQHLPGAEAMRRAVEMVAAYARAGFTKIHLDASMACADDPSPLPEEIIAERASLLCAAAESHAAGRVVCYVIGTEVPVPGGATESLAGLEITPATNVHRTVAIHREAFERVGLGSVWPRVIAMVVQPGVEFNHETVVDYRGEETIALQAALVAEPGLVYEAHSTDYQRPAAYRELVRDGFAILKVGPALTFAMREALFALAAIEDDLVPQEEASGLRDVVEQVMLTERGYWSSHYHGDARTQFLLRRYSYSDRIRYYWSEPRVDRAVRALFANLSGRAIPEPMLSQHLPEQYAAVRAGELRAGAEELVLHKIRRALEPYAAACRTPSPAMLLPVV